MSNEKEIRKLIVEVFEQRLSSAITKMTNMQEDFSDRKDRLVQEVEKIGKVGKQDDPATYGVLKLQIDSLQTEIDNLYIMIRILKSLERF